MSDETGLETKGKLNKKFLIGAVAVIAVVLVVTLAIFLPKSAEARKLSESLNLGDKYLSELNYEQAVVSYLEVIEIDPKNVDAYLGLADAYLAQGEYVKAIDVLKNAMEEIGEDSKEAEQLKKKLAEAKAKNAAEGTQAPVPTNAPVSSGTPTLEDELSAIERISSEIYNNDIFQWWVTSTGKVVISGLVDNTMERITVPETIEGKPVIALGRSCFSSCPNLTEVSLPDSLLVIGDCAFFHSESLTNVTFHENLLEIGNRAFDGCYALTNIVLPDSLKTIGETAFNLCRNLTSLVIPVGLEQIGEGAFMQCYKLEQFIVKEGNRHFTAVDGVLFDSDMKMLVSFPANKAVDIYKVPDGVEVLAAYAFWRCDAAEITLPETLREIGDNAFGICNNVKQLYIPKNVVKIGKYIVTGIKTIEIAEENPAYICEDLQIFSKDRSILVSVLGRNNATTYSVPSQVKRIERYAFNENCSLKEIILPDGLEEIGEGAFFFCREFNHIDLPDSLKIIEKDAFRMCSALESIVIPGNVSSIGEYAFYNCAKLSSVIIENGVEILGSGAFSYCDALTSITIPGSVIDIPKGAFRGSANVTIYTPAGSYAETYAIQNGIPYKNN